METIYRHLRYAPSEIPHRYGPNVHILAHPFLLTVLARLCHPRTIQPEFSRLVALLYRSLAVIVANAEFPRTVARSLTRMKAHYEGEIIDPRTRVVCVNIARAGYLPSQVCFETFCEVLEPKNVRQDHLFMNRRHDGNGRVVGVDFSGSKVGGPVRGSILVVPDPMGATGSSLERALDHYATLGRVRKAIAVHLIVTPEYLRRLRDRVTVYAIRLDRGLSRRDVLATVPGTRWAEEKGLNPRDYIVPGGGGFGELLSNAEV